VDPRDEDFAPRNQIYFVSDRIPDPRNHIFSWLPTRGSNRRSDFLTKLLAKCDSRMDRVAREKAALETLEGIWKILTKDIAWRFHMVSETRPGQGLVYQANPEMWEIRPLRPDQPVYQCTHCKGLTTVNM
jgi:hypothetical protein